MGPTLPDLLQLHMANGIAARWSSTRTHPASPGPPNCQAYSCGFGLRVWGSRNRSVDSLKPKTSCSSRLLLEPLSVSYGLLLSWYSSYSGRSLERLMAALELGSVTSLLRIQAMPGITETCAPARPVSVRRDPLQGHHGAGAGLVTGSGRRPFSDSRAISGCGERWPLHTRLQHLS